MFQSKTKPSHQNNETTIIGNGTCINGDIDTGGDIRVDGMLNGNIIHAAKILIGPEGTVTGNISGAEADVLGKVSGAIKVKGLLVLRSKGNVNGDIFAEKLQVEPSATFNGNCHMGANVVEIHSEKANVINL